MALFSFERVVSGRALHRDLSEATQLNIDRIFTTLVSLRMTSGYCIKAPSGHMNSASMILLNATGSFAEIEYEPKSIVAATIPLSSLGCVSEVRLTICTYSANNTLPRVPTDPASVPAMFATKSGL